MARDNSMNFIGSRLFRGTALGPEEYLPGPRKRTRLMTQEEMERYDKMVTKSKGFDVDGCTGSMPGRIAPIPSGCRDWKVSYYLATWAAESKYPDKRLEVLSLDKANCQGIGGSMYYLTFTAKDIVDENKIKRFRAKVWRKPDNKLELDYFQEFKPPQKAVTPHKAQSGGKSSNRSKKSKEKKGAVVQRGSVLRGFRAGKSSNRSKKSKEKKGAVAQRGSVLGGFRALCKEMKEENPSWTHSKAMAAASDKWKSLSSAKKKFYISGTGTSFKQA